MGGLLRYKKWVPQQLGMGDVADMQLPCYQTRESPSSGKCSIFFYRHTYAYWTFLLGWNSSNSNRKLFATRVPILPWMGPHVSFNSTWQLSSSPRLQWQHVIIGQRTLAWWYMDVCIVPLWHHHHECRISTHCNYLVVMSVSWLTDHPPATASSRLWCHHSPSFNSNYCSTHWQDL